MTSHQLEYPPHTCIKTSPALVWWQISSEAAPEVTEYEDKRSSGHLDRHRCKQICVTSVHSCLNYQILIIAHSLIYREEIIQLKIYQTTMRDGHKYFRKHMFHIISTCLLNVSK